MSSEEVALSSLMELSDELGMKGLERESVMRLSGGEEAIMDLTGKLEGTTYLIEVLRPGKPDTFFGTEIHRKFTWLSAAMRATKEDRVKVLMVLCGDLSEGFYSRLHGFFKNYAPPGFEWMASWEQDQFLTSDTRFTGTEQVKSIEDRSVRTKITTLHSADEELKFTRTDLQIISYMIHQQTGAIELMGESEEEEIDDQPIRNPSELADRTGFSRSKCYKLAAALNQAGFLITRSRDEFQLQGIMDLLSGFEGIHASKMTGFQFEDQGDVLRTSLQMLWEMFPDSYRRICTLSGPAATDLYDVSNPCDGPVLLYRSQKEQVIEEVGAEDVTELRTFLKSLPYAISECAIDEADLLAVGGDPPYRIRANELSGESDLEDDVFVADPVGVFVDCLNVNKKYAECAEKFLKETVPIQSDDSEEAK